jgi:hypothetical protein
LTLGVLLASAAAPFGVTSSLRSGLVAHLPTLGATFRHNEVDAPASHQAFPAIGTAGSSSGSWFETAAISSEQAPPTGSTTPLFKWVPTLTVTTARAPPPESGSRTLVKEAQHDPTSMTYT